MSNVSDELKGKIQQLRDLCMQLESLEEDILDECVNMCVPDVACIFEDIIGNATNFPTTEACCNVLGALLHECAAESKTTKKKRTRSSTKQ